MAEKDELEATAKLFRRLIRICVRQEVEEYGLLPDSKPDKKTPGRVVKPKSPLEAARDRERKTAQALGLE